MATKEKNAYFTVIILKRCRKKIKCIISPLVSNDRNQKDDKLSPEAELKGAFFTVFRNV